MEADLQINRNTINCFRCCERSMYGIMLGHKGMGNDHVTCDSRDFATYSFFQPSASDMVMLTRNRNSRYPCFIPNLGVKALNIVSYFFKFCKYYARLKTYSSIPCYIFNLECILSHPFSLFMDIIFLLYSVNVVNFTD